MMEVVKKPRVLLLVILLIISLLSIAINSIPFGIDFEGGTVFQVHLDESVPPEKMGTITSIISERLDAFGLKDTKVNSLGSDFVSAQIAETDPDRIEQLETLLRTQGRFESILDGEVLFEGEDILQVYKDAANGFGVRELGEGAYEYQLPFLLSQKATESFSRGTFHRCTATSFDVQSGTTYDCASTYFFIDRPTETVAIVPSAVFANDSVLFQQGNRLENIPQGTSVEELMLNSKIPYLVVNEDQNFTREEETSLREYFENNENVIVHPAVSSGKKDILLGLGYEVNEIDSEENVPWLWTATGARQVISLTPGIANLDPYVEDINKAKVFSRLLITGTGASMEGAFDELKATQVLLETGSLPIGIKSISKETISPLLGKEFLNNVLLIGLVSLVVVSLVVFVRYRVLKLVIPIMITGASEIILILGFASLIQYNLDLAAVAGILAAVGTGVDHQIIITDEIMRGKISTSGTFVNRVKKAFFIIFAAAATTIATMLPIVLFSFGLGKLRGFALITVVGVLLGILITRPAFSVMAEYVLKNQESTE